MGTKLIRFLFTTCVFHLNTRNTTCQIGQFTRQLTSKQTEQSMWSKQTRTSTENLDRVEMGGRSYKTTFDNQQSIATN